MPPCTRSPCAGLTRPNPATNRVPFTGFRSHSSNGVLFCIDDDCVYASCMKRECCATMLSSRHEFITRAMRWEREAQGQAGSKR